VARGGPGGPGGRKPRRTGRSGGGGPSRGTGRDRPERSSSKRQRHPNDRREPPRAYVPRDEATIVYGRNPVREAIRGSRAVAHVWAIAAIAREQWLRDAGVVVDVASPDEIVERAGTEHHQGVVAEVSPFAYADLGDLLAVEAPVLVALDEVTDPQNLGAICRTAEVSGATGLVIPDRRSAAVTSVVAKASAGAIEHLPIAQVGNLADALADAKRAGCWIYGAAADGAIPYDQPDYDGGVVLVLGSEGKGLRPRVAATCDALVAIPRAGRVASLNVSAAAAVLLYEILQRRRGT
jgi:23S rRNA (guanosine2251-2'-O)-methyltransferase